MRNVTVNGSNWMSGVEDATPIHQMSIPGSHESCSLWGGGPTQCQSLSITDQLTKGVRFLDVRCVNAVGTSDDDFPVFHGGVYQETSFRAVQRECVAFLTSHPGETILMNVQQEKNPMLVNKPDAEFETKFLRLIDRGRWSFPDWIPKLQEFRGQIILIRPYNDSTNEGWTGANLPGGAGLAWKGFCIDGTSYDTHFEVQNGWAKWSNSPDKAKAVRQHLQLAAAGTVGADRIYLNFLSRAAGAYVGTAASEVNNDICNFLKTTLTNTGRRLGVLPIDFVGNTGTADSLENLIIRHNRFEPSTVFAP